MEGGGGDIDGSNSFGKIATRNTLERGTVGEGRALTAGPCGAAWREEQ